MDTIITKLLKATPESYVGVTFENDLFYVLFKQVENEDIKDTKIKLSTNAGIVLYHLLEDIIQKNNFIKNYEEIKSLNSKK